MEFVLGDGSSGRKWEIRVCGGVRMCVQKLLSLMYCCLIGSSCRSDCQRPEGHNAVQGISDARVSRKEKKQQQAESELSLNLLEALVSTIITRPIRTVQLTTQS
eukprot:923177-Amphidinium_carterae.2